MPEQQTSSGRRAVVKKRFIDLTILWSALLAIGIEATVDEEQKRIQRLLEKNYTAFHKRVNTKIADRLSTFTMFVEVAERIGS